ncbi:TetR/AcrR family transcriptional regulator [Streptantibioticus ferralitis]|uniref:TetR/AcrR family transcriptional regulator n=1 Tax=Streptantibioticus ferralitis TaxID=236510 RepID=A0ABT5YTQ4_9ACTN|nr:TetR/AcrR family transcriptional regulator [Streptantibioticus ferralitis]MDF2254838.1 TetR/AcrR family transcriptional regulator [Streptantibioticus ferralitis]
MTERRRKGSDTKAEIQEVALHLFAENGYEATSMREIAERLDISKAALYYHFAGKEDIIRALFDEYVQELDDLLAWGRTQPRSATLRDEILSRWVDLSGRRGLQIARFATTNQHVIRDLAPDRGGVKGRIAELVDLILGPDAAPADQLRARVALFSVNLASFAAQDLSLPDLDILTVAREVANTLMPGGEG